MGMSLWWWATILLMAVTAALLLAGTPRQKAPRHVGRRFEEALRGDGAGSVHLGRFDQGDAKARLLARLERFSSGELDEVQRLLAQAGWADPRPRFTFLVAAWLGPLAAALAAGFYGLANGAAGTDALLYLIFAFALVFVFMRRFLRWRAQKRQKAMRMEVVAMLHLLRMLFDAGLSLEHTLQVVEQQGRDLVPNLAEELTAVLKRIQAGQERGEALSEMAAPLEVPELNDTIAMLKQATRYGGSIRDSLVEYTKLIEQRQISELREYVSKLSAKMTVVMVVFLFPALMIFVAGPGFVGLASALSSLGS